MEALKPIEHKFKAFVFRLFSGILKKGKGDFEPLDGNAIRRVLFLRPEKIGDMVISFPVFDGLTDAYPHIKISILGSPRNYALIGSDSRFEEIFLYTKNVWKDFKTLLKMRRENYDCVVDMICDDSVTALFLSQLVAKSKPRIGVGKVKYREYYDFNYDHRMGDTGHIIQNTLKLLDAFGIDSDRVDPYAAPFLPDDAVRKAGEFIDSLYSSPDGLLVGYNLSAGAPTRIWAHEKSVELIRRIRHEEPSCTVVLFAVGNDRTRAEAIQRDIGSGVCIVPPGLNLIEASAVISKLDVMISPDTSLVHIARSFKVRVVGLYSRFMKNFLLWKPFGQEYGAVVSGNDDNIFDITVDQVMDEFVKVVAKAREAAG